MELFPFKAKKNTLEGYTDDKNDGQIMSLLVIISSECLTLDL